MSFLQILNFSPLRSLFETRWFCSLLTPLRMKCVFRSCLEMVPCAWFPVRCETTFDADRVGLEPRAQARRAAEPFVIGCPTVCGTHKSHFLTTDFTDHSLPRSPLGAFDPASSCLPMLKQSLRDLRFPRRTLGTRGSSDVWRGAR